MLVHGTLSGYLFDHIKGVGFFNQLCTSEALIVFFFSANLVTKIKIAKIAILRDPACLFCSR